MWFIYFNSLKTIFLNKIFSKSFGLLEKLFYLCLVKNLLTNKNIIMKRTEIFEKVRELGLQVVIRETTGKSYHAVTTEELMKFIDDATTNCSKITNKIGDSFIDMNITFIKAKEDVVKRKANPMVINIKNGQIFFNQTTIKFMEQNKYTHFKIGRNDKDKFIYFTKCDDGDSFKMLTKKGDLMKTKFIKNLSVKIGLNINNGDYVKFNLIPQVKYDGLYQLKLTNYNGINTNKITIKHNSATSRLQLYKFIRENNLSQIIKEQTGKPYNNLSESVLRKIINM